MTVGIWQCWRLDNPHGVRCGASGEAQVLFDQAPQGVQVVAASRRLGGGVHWPDYANSWGMAYADP
ncbi:MAG: hypothetical protein FWD62_12160 [Betaproteobacteria bacterium]|nr:hypothetical protein [Betaproteobacteria bacterium]